MWRWTRTLSVSTLLTVVSSARSSSVPSTSSGTLNTLTTSCSGGCNSSTGACVVVGQSSTRFINCVNDTNCVTLSSGQSALCLDAFASTATEWVFQPTESNDSAGAGPFERVGLLQLAGHVTDLTFSRAEERNERLSESLELASLNIQSDVTLDKVTFGNLSLSGLDSALPLNGIKRMYVAVGRLRRRS
uniref:RxLR effector candidate protein n=1 Tax=Hyaloperonospora arabidopsidis (strain Emoy2) TaxID=559515 RepID=M4BFR1_HYAAE